MGAIRRFLAGLQPKQRRLLALCLLAATGLAVFFGVFARDADRTAIAAALRDPLSVFSSRSPGARVSGVLIKTKRARVATKRGRPAPPAVVLPRERVLSPVRTRMPPALALGGDGPGAFLAPPDADFALPSIGLPASAPGFDVPPFAFGNGPDIAPQGGPSVPPNVPGPAVPEPSTWVMMTLALGIVGSLMRRKARLEAERACAQGG